MVKFGTPTNSKFLFVWFCAVPCTQITVKVASAFWVFVVFVGQCASSAREYDCFECVWRGVMCVFLVLCQFERKKM